MKEKRILTKRDTPIAKRSAPPSEAVEEEDDGDKTIPMPEPWFQDHDKLYGEPCSQT